MIDAGLYRYCKWHNHLNAKLTPYRATYRLSLHYDLCIRFFAFPQFFLGCALKDLTAI